ncbi:MAG: hypothetical protein ABH821_05685 [archaeon]
MKKKIEVFLPPSVFISSYNYPKISLAPLSSQQTIKDLTFYSTINWFGLTKQEILNRSTSLLSSKKNVSPSSARNPGYELKEIQESVMSENPLQAELQVNNFYSGKTEFSNYIFPLKQKSNLESFKLIDNPVIPKKVDYLVSDIDVKSVTALNELFSKNFEVDYLQKILSVGLLGVKKDRRFVPTRFSITAVDSITSNKLVSDLKSFKQLQDYRVFNLKFIENSFIILLLPTEWCFEQLELMLGSKTFSHDFEFYSGRKTYASNVLGAYYAARLAVTEYYKKIQRQGGAIIFRETKQSYKSLGVWLIRESVRNALQENFKSFNNLDDSLKFIQTLLQTDLKSWKKQSKIIDKQLKQKKLSEWS